MTGNQLAHFMLAFAAKRAIQHLPEPSLRLSVMGQNLFFVLVPHTTTQMPFSGASRLQRCAPWISIAAQLRLWHQLRWVRTNRPDRIPPLQGRKGSDRARITFNLF